MGGHIQRVALLVKEQKKIFLMLNQVTLNLSDRQGRTKNDKDFLSKRAGEPGFVMLEYVYFFV